MGQNNKTWQFIRSITHLSYLWGSTLKPQVNSNSPYQSFSNKLLIKAQDK